MILLHNVTLRANMKYYTATEHTSWVVFCWHILSCWPVGCKYICPDALLDNRKFLRWCQQNIGRRGAHHPVPCSVVIYRKVGNTKLQCICSLSKRIHWIVLFFANLHFESPGEELPGGIKLIAEHLNCQFLHHSALIIFKLNKDSLHFNKLGF